MWTALRDDRLRGSGTAISAQRTQSGWTLIRCLLGLLLMAAAGLKLSDLAAGSVSPTIDFTSLPLQVGTADIEVILGLWLTSGLYARSAWRASLSFFSLLSCVSLYLALEGRPSCGCSGSRLTVNPWYTFALDVTALLALVAGHSSPLWFARTQHVLGRNPLLTAPSL